MNLLIKDQPYLSNYIYKFEYIYLISNYLKEVNLKNNSLKAFILSIITNDLIDNYRAIEDFYDINCEKELKDIVDNNAKIIKDFCSKNELKINFYKIDNNIESIYLKIIINLIKNEKLVDYEYSSNIFDQLNLKKINLTEYIFDELLNFFKDEENIIKKYIIKDINNLFDTKIMNFYYILLQYIFKNSFYIYYVPFLLNTRKAILKILKFDIDKLSNYDLNDNNIKQRMEYILEFFCDSDYYYMKYYKHKKNANYSKLKEVLQYYKNIFFETKKEDIKIIENILNNMTDKTNYEKFLKDYEKVKK